ISEKESPRREAICHTAMTTAAMRKKVWKVSVHTMVLMPPLKVYNQISTMVVATVTKKGMSQASNKNSCSTVAARYNRNDEPMVRDTIKKNAPVLYDQKSKRCSR